MILNASIILPSFSQNPIKNKNLCCTFYNIRSLKKNFDALLVAMKDAFSYTDIIVLAETNISSLEQDNFLLNGYEANFKNRDVRRGGGIAIYVKNHLKFEKIEIVANHFEVIGINLTIDKMDITVLAIYRPPGFSSMSTFATELDSIVKGSGISKNLIILGDINIDILKDNESLHYKDVISSNGLVMCNDVIPTRVDIGKGSKTNIDHAIVRIKNKNSIVHSSIIELTISDHYAIQIDLETGTNERNEPKIPQKMCLDQTKINLLIHSTDWERIGDEGDAETIYKSIYNKFQEIYTKSIANRKKNCVARSQSPWINKEILALCEKRDYLYRFWKYKPNDLQRKKEYTTCRNMVNKRILTAKNTYYRKKFKEYTGDLRKMWALANEVTGRRKKTNTSVDSIIPKKI